MFTNRFDSTWHDDRYYCALYFDTRLIDLDLDSMSQECEKAKTSAPIILQSFQLIWMEIGTLLRIVGMMNLIIILFHPLSNQGREPNFCDFVSKNFNVGFYSDISRPISFRFGMMIERTKLYIMVSLWMTLTFIQGHSCIRNKKFGCPFSHQFGYQFGLNSACCHNLLVCWSSC